MKTISILTIQLLTLLTSTIFIGATSSHEILSKNLAINPEQPIKNKKNKKNKKLIINFNNEDIIDVINYIAAHKEVNIVLPTGVNALNFKITWQLPEEITIKQAWNDLHSILDVAGYSIVLQPNMYEIVKNSKNVGRETVPLYIGSRPEELPNTDERIRLIYYLNNLKVSDDPKSELRTILSEFLPIDTANVQLEPRTNAIIITERANEIRSIMQIITALDSITYQERLEIIKLYHTSADTVAKLFTDNILKTASSQPGTTAQRKSEPSYFSENVKIIPEARSNHLFILGRGQTVDRMKEFITKYIDVELDSGNSILHIYQLLYLDAVSFAGVLQKIVEADRGNGTGQSSALPSKFGIERYFDGVIIKSDQVDGQSSFGSNKLIIAAKSDDWNYIRNLIEKLDRPQPQVIIEVLAADLTFDDIRKLGSMVRNPRALPTPGSKVFPFNLDAQAAQAGPLVVSEVDGKNTIASDLLARTVPTSSGTPVSVAELTGIGDPGQPGSTLLSFSDKGTGSTFALIQILKTFASTKILSHPHVVTTNNKQAIVSIGEQRLLTGETTATAAAPTIKTDLVDAKLTVTLIPRISPDESVSLHVKIEASDFEPGAGNQRTIRNIETYAHVQSSDILAIGGLTRAITNDILNETPLLSKIPVLGWFFKSRSGEILKSNLVVFICPTVVQPRLRKGIDTYTKEYVELAGKYASENQLFEGLRDPITRFFFKSQQYDARQNIAEFMVTDEFKHDTQITPSTPMTGELPRVTPRPEPSIDTHHQKTPEIAHHKPEPTAPQIPKPQVQIADTKHASKTRKLMELLADTENPLLRV